MGPISRIAATTVAALLLAHGTSTAWAASPSVAAPTAADSYAPLSLAEAKTRPTLQRHDRGVWVRRLNAAFHITPGRSFGKATARAVKKFRAAHGQKARPVVTTRTWMALGTRIIVPTPTPAPTAPPTQVRPQLEYGDVSSWVQVLQVALGVDADGHFGPVTLAAVKAFQQSAGLPVTGIVDAATWSALGDRVTDPVIDVTTTQSARTSRAHRESIGVAAFASSWTARMVVDRESGGQCDIVNPSGTYRGKWQMDAAFWSAYGGTEFAPRPDLATCDEQDVVAYRGWVDRWWQPWPTAIP